MEHDCSFHSDFGADLFMLMELISKIEDEFGKRFGPVSSVQTAVFLDRHF